MKKDTFFTDAYKKLPKAEAENYHKAVFLNMEGEHAAKLRLEYYKKKLKHLGKNVKIGCGVKLVNPENIHLGDNVEISDNCVLFARSKEGIFLDDGVRLMYGVYLDTENQEGYMKIGKRVYIGTSTCLHGHKGLEIGDDTLMAQNITLTPYSHIFNDPKKTIISQGGNARKVVIGRDCYIGMNATILYSSGIGEGSVIGSGAVVVHPVPPYSVAVGVPARVIKQRG